MRKDVEKNEETLVSTNYVGCFCFGRLSKQAGI